MLYVYVQRSHLLSQKLFTILKKYEKQLKVIESTILFNDNQKTWNSF